MKVRKFAVALALAGGLGSGLAQALGLGEIELQSYLNEPLEAEIALPKSRGVDPADVRINIASKQAYERVGLERNRFLSELRFEVLAANDGSLVVNVSSDKPLREPYLDFLLELTWPSGRLLREYAVLLDPPVYAEDSGIREQVSAPVTTTTQPTSPPATNRSLESARRQAEAEQSLGAGYPGDTFRATRTADTLWAIATQVRRDSDVSIQQVMLALQDLNPDAFIDNNINRLKRGEVLRIPTLEQSRSRTLAQAIGLVRQQNQEFQTSARVVDATAAPEPEPEVQESGVSGGDELKLVVPEQTGPDASEGGSAGGDSDVPGGVDAGTAVALEELESARRENDELNSRVDDLEDQVRTLQRLIELKSTELAEVQREVDRSSEQGEQGEQSDDTAASSPDTEAQTPAPAKSFPGNAIEAIIANPSYQIALGGGLIVVLLLALLLSRRNANRETELYDDLENEADDDTDAFDVSLTKAEPTPAVDEPEAQPRVDQSGPSDDAGGTVQGLPLEFEDSEKTDEAEPDIDFLDDSFLDDLDSDLDSGIDPDLGSELDSGLGSEPGSEPDSDLEEVSEEPTETPATDIDNDEQGDEDDFDFLAGTDEAATKLDLARAYLEMSDFDGARGILEEVLLEGNEDQKVEAQDLLKNLS